MKVSREEYRALKAKAQARASRRLEKVAENAALATGTVIGPKSTAKAPPRVFQLVCVQVPAPPLLKRRQKSPRQKLIKLLDDTWSLLVRLRDKKLTGGLCRICGKRPIQIGYHLHPRGSYATRWLPENGCGACTNCNAGEKWHRLKYREKHCEIFGYELIETLEEKAREITNYSMADLREILASLKAQLEGRA